MDTVDCRKIYILDSLPGGHSRLVFRNIRRYLEQEASVKLREVLDPGRFRHYNVKVS
jgi:hypothetical protein